MLISIGIFVGRLSGYIREIAIAWRFDVSELSDNIILILTIPDFINNLLSTTSIGAVLIPLLISNEVKKNNILHDFLLKVIKISTFSILFMGIIVIMNFQSDIRISLLISLVSVLPNTLTALLISFLQSKNKFRETSFATLYFNVPIIVFILLFNNLIYIAIGIIISALLRYLYIYFNSKKNNYVTINDNENYISYKTIIISIVANGLFYLVPILDKYQSSYLDSGSTTILSYAEKIYLLPTSIILTTYAIASFPKFSKEFIESKKTILNTLNNSLILNLALSLFIIVILFISGYKLINLIYGFVGISETSLNKIHITLNGYLGSVLTAGSISILVNILFILKKSKVIIFLSIISLLIKYSLNTIIISQKLDVSSFAYTTSILNIGICVVMYIYISQTLKKINENQ